MIVDRTIGLRLLRRLKAEDGVALPTVFGLSLIMLMLVATSMTVVTGGLRKTNSDEDWNAALAAAYAGVEEYQSRLANSTTYQRFGNPAAPFTVDSGSDDTVTLPIDDDENPAFGIGTSGTWASVPAPGNPVIASFRYEVDNSEFQNTGILRIRSTGRVGEATRSIVANLKQDGFIDYLWFTDYETLDPTYYGITQVDSNNKNVCERYAYGSPARSDSTCGTIRFASDDEFGGEVRSNDRMIICETTFHGKVITSNTDTPIFETPSGCGAPTFDIGSGPVYDGRIEMPPTNTELTKEVRNDLPTDVPLPGCLYTGPTVITFETDASGNPKMRVLSPWTKYTNTAATTAGATSPTQCGKIGNVTDGLGSPTGALIDVLDMNLVYVQAVPTIGSDDPNAPADNDKPDNFYCTKGKWWNDTPPGWSYYSGGYVARFPVANERTPYGASYLEHYGCKAGDLYVEGTLGGQITLAAANYVYVTGDLTYLDKQEDILGLIGTNAVYVWNPVDDDNDALNPDSNNREIEAAILSVAHTFQVQNYNRGARETLTVFGSIAQKFRGTVGQGSSGYAKHYQYDARFKDTAPPKFLSPASTTYKVTQFATVPAAFSADGAER